MKHKAQNSLDNYCLIGCMKKGISREERYIPDKNIQELIDCQLTEEEIRTINTALNRLEVDYELDKTLMIYRTKGLERIESIMNKLNKQKEMWCEDER